ncbi:MAG: endonuclease NucS domain-containing protein [Cyanobacteria bacterium P01_C01_bin.69]
MTACIATELPSLVFSPDAALAASDRSIFHMSFIQTNQQWHFNSELELEETVWRNLPALLNIEPLSRQFSIAGKVCDLLAIDDTGRLVIIELKNTEDRYIVQQLTRYYDALKSEHELPFSADTTRPRLVGIAPNFHRDTLIDCHYSTLSLELLTFHLNASADDIKLTLRDTSNTQVSALLLPNALSIAQSEIEIPEPPRKLLNWLSRSSEKEYDWVMRLRRQLLSFDPRMKEVVTSTSIFYGRGKTKACCELRKTRPNKVRNRAITYFLWLPHPEYSPHTVRMMVCFNLQQQQIRQLIYCRTSYRTSASWNFPDRPNIMGVMRGMPRFKEHYRPLLNSKQSINSADIVDLALRTWHRKL